MSSSTPKKRSLRQEKQVAKEVSGYTTIASGALCFQKGDVRSDELLIECKTTAKKSFILTRTVWDKIKKEALHDNMRLPVLAVDFRDGQSRAALFKYEDLGQQFLTRENLLDMLAYMEWRNCCEVQCLKFSLTLHEEEQYQLIHVVDSPDILMRVPWCAFLELLDQK